MAVLPWIETQLSKQHGHIFPWAAVFFGLGVWGYFSLRFEPDPIWVGFGVVLAITLGVLLRRRGLGLRCLVLLPTLSMLGFGAACLQAHMNSAPRLEFHYYGPIQGRVVRIDRSGSHAVRLTLDRVVLAGVLPEKTPNRVRVSLHGKQEWLEPMPGQVVGLTGHLSAPNGPVEPGGFDFQRHAWFLQLGAVGYTRSPALEMMPANTDRRIDRLRHHIAGRVSDYLGGDIGGFAAAVTTGDRSAFSQQAMQALRVSNLAHLLAISGLHMGLLAGFLFASIRLGLSVWQPWALRLPVKKIAALAALVGASGYLLLSGASIATQRAYIVAAVALLAVFLDRRALTLRAVAIAALLVLALRPSSLLSPGFQMSFAATTALVWVFSLLRDAPEMGLRRWQKSVAALVMSSLVAGLATAPFAAAHFNQWAAYGLLANVSAVPAMGLVVIPGAVLAALLSPVGLEWVGLEVMGVGLRWILAVAMWVSGLEGARVPIVTPQAAVLPLIALAGCWLVLWQGVLRWGGALVIGVAVLQWSQSVRPDVLISDNGKLVGVMTSSGRALSKGRGQGFVALSWLENDGDAVDQEEAARRLHQNQKGVFCSYLTPGSKCEGGPRPRVGEKPPQSNRGFVFDKTGAVGGCPALRPGGDFFRKSGDRCSLSAKSDAKGAVVQHFQGKKGMEALHGCNERDIVVYDQSIKQDLPCLAFGKDQLAKSGAVAIWALRDGLQIETVAKQRGRRLWSPPAQLDIRSDQ